MFKALRNSRYIDAWLLWCNSNYHACLCSFHQQRQQRVARKLACWLCDSLDRVRVQHPTWMISTACIVLCTCRDALLMGHYITQGQRKIYYYMEDVDTTSTWSIFRWNAIDCVSTFLMRLDTFLDLRVNDTDCHMYLRKVVYQSIYILIKRYLKCAECVRVICD